MKKVLILLITVVPFMFTSCNDDDVRLRLKNDSSMDFDAVFVSTTGPEKVFGPLASGKSSDYMVFEGLYRYAYIRVEVDDMEYVLQPIDYVGETPLSSGDYTYRLDIYNPSDPWSITLEFVKE